MKSHGSRISQFLQQKLIDYFTNHNFHFLTFKFHNYFLVSVFHLEYNGHNRGRIWLHVGFWWHILGASNVFLAGTVSCWPTREAPLDHSCCNSCFIRYVKKVSRSYSALSKCFVMHVLARITVIFKGDIQTWISCQWGLVNVKSNLWIRQQIIYCTCRKQNCQLFRHVHRTS